MNEESENFARSLAATCEDAAERAVRRARRSLHGGGEDRTDVSTETYAMRSAAQTSCSIFFEIAPIGLTRKGPKGVSSPPSCGWPWR
jgi:hypothetical protein